MLTSSSAYMAGGPQGPVKFDPLRHDMAPRPMLAPTPMAPFLTDGRTITHSARSNTGLGRLSGMLRISISTSPACRSRPCSFSWPCTRKGRSNNERVKAKNFFMNASLSTILLYQFESEIRTGRAFNGCSGSAIHLMSVGVKKRPYISNTEGRRFLSVQNRVAELAQVELHQVETVFLEILCR